MSDIVVNLSEPNSAKYFFGHQIGQRVTSRTGDFQGTLKEAIFSGPDDGGACEVICDVQADDGRIIRTHLVNVEKM